MERIYKDKTIPIITIMEMNKCVKEMNSKISHDFNGISNRMLKHIPSKFKEVILKLFNDCLSSF